MSRWYSANILHVASGSKHLYELQARSDRYVLQQKQDFLPSEKLPAEAVGKGWRSLFRPKLNLAWLPADKAFLRVVHLPSSDPAEVGSMIELQLEKLSPLPVTQIVWSFQLLPKPTPESLQSVVVAIAARGFVEEFLGDLEGKGFLADRLEVPSLDQLIATEIREDGVWIYPGGAEGPALIAWWSDKTLQNLTLLALPEGQDKVKTLTAQVEQLAWAGELEGWLKAMPRVHLVAEGAEAEFWERALREWAGGAVEVMPALKTADLAALSARRCVSDESKTSLLPPEFATRYHQQFIDRLWMRGLFGLLVVYAVGVLAYFAALTALKYQYGKVEAQVKSVTGSYTNALRNEALIQIYKDRQELQYAALDCWRAVARSMSNSITLEDFQFQREKLELRGTVPSDDKMDVTALNDALRKESIFTDVSPPSFNTRGQNDEWRFSCTLKGGGK